MPTITKSALAREVAESTGSSKAVAAATVDLLFRAMLKELAEGKRIEIRRFGALTVKATAPKPAARNPRTGEIIAVPARRKAHFRAGRVLKEALRGERQADPTQPV